MAKLLVLLVVLSVGGNYQVGAQFGGDMFGIGNIIRDIAGSVSHAIQRFSGPNEKFVKAQQESIKSIQKNILENEKVLNQTNIDADIILDKLYILNEDQRDLTRSLLLLNDTFTLVDLKIQLIMERLNAITYQLDNLPIYLAERTDRLLQNFATRLRGQRNLLDAKGTFKKYVRKVDIMYNKFLSYTRPGAKLRYDTMEAFINTILSPYADEMIKGLNQMQQLLTPGESGSIYNGLFQFLTSYQSMQTFDERCDLESSYQEQFRELYRIVIVCELRAYTMQIFAMNYLYARGEESEGSMKGEIGMIVERTLKRISAYFRGMKKVMRTASREIYRCEPKKHLLDETSFRLNDLFGKYYLSRQQLNPQVHQEPEEINTFSYVECLNRYEFDDSFVKYYCPRYQCPGRLHKCENVVSFKFCEATIGTSRRYNFGLDGNLPNKPFDCRGRYIDILTKTNDNLLCQCSEEGAESLATRAINLMPQMSDIKNNMVVTNVRFLKKNNMVHLEIEEGLLLPEGNIDMSTVSRVPVGNFRYQQTSPEGSYVMLDPNEWDDKEIPLTYDKNYTFLRHDRATINLDEIVVDKGFVVTGVKFDTEHNNPEEGINKSPIQLKVLGTPFDYNTGLLRSPEISPSKWFTPIDMKGKLQRYDYMRTEIYLSNRDDSIKNTGPVQGSEANHRVTFQTTSWLKDMGQTVVPYFDGLSAMVSNKFALDGIGIFFRGPEEDYGGFIAPKVFTLDHSQYINPGISRANIAKYKTAWIPPQ